MSILYILGFKTPGQLALATPFKQGGTSGKLRTARTGKLIHLRLLLGKCGI
jgi:hypothetical protein